MAPERVGREDTLAKDLFVVDAETPVEASAQLGQIGSSFVCLVAWDSRSASVSEISALAGALLDAGAVYVCAWGAGCERVHDIVDEERDARNPDGPGVVMTTWHQNESLGDVLWFVLKAAIPDDTYLSGWRATVGVAVGSRDW